MAAMSQSPTDGDKGLESLNRPLSREEQELVLWLIEHGSSDDKPQLRAQVSALTVHWECRCGCPSVNFALNGAPVEGKGRHIIAHYLAEVDGMEVGVILCDRNGVLTSLEVYSFVGSDKPFGLPKIATFQSFKEQSIS
jgi:hypothetical protein